jgi:signal transduction histidine kinase
LGGGFTLAGSLVLVLFLAARALVFNRIREIRESVSQMSFSELDRKTKRPGDELKEIADFCYMLDDRLRNQHQELARKIADATHDLSETNKNLEAANKQLASLNKAKSDFFTDVSHELRTPLTSIKGAADILERKAACSDPIYLDIIKRNTDHLTKILIDFLDYSKIEAGQMELELEDASLKAVAEDAMLSQQAVAQKKSVQLVLESSVDISARIDKKRIYQVLTNLLSNAIRFSPEHGMVKVRVEQAAPWIRVSVEDQGPGIAAEYHQAIFEKFYQVPDLGKTNIHKGSAGIGLAICKGIVKAHGGNIWVESGQRKGSRFVFAIPTP